MDTINGIRALAGVISGAPGTQDGARMATVSRIDSDGTVYVRFPEGTQDMPVHRCYATVQPGDAVPVEIREGRATIGNNATDLPASTSALVDVSDTAFRAVRDAATASAAASSAVASAEAAGEAASQAIADAAEAKTAASQAAQDAASAASSAQSAQEDAQTASTAATSAQGSAATAATAAQQAQSDAADAASAAQAAQDDAASAQGSASQAAQSASTAQQQAQAATTAANEAKADAKTAKESAESAVADAADAKAASSRASKHADAALDQLGIVQDVAGILTWASEHGSFAKTSDTAIVEGKVYFVKDGSDYTPVIDPDASQLSTYYELTVDDAMGDFVMSHLAVTSRGLWVLPNGIGSASTPQTASGYKALLASDGMYLYDGSGVLVTKYGESIDFSSTRPQRIGNETAYIEYYDSDNDGVPDAIRISGTNINTAISTAESAITQQAGQIDAKVSKDGVIAAINLSTETEGGSTAKIHASKVEIDGIAIFSAISDDVDDAITGKGYATTTQAQGYANTAESNAKAAIPTKVSQLNNDSSFATTTQVSDAVDAIEVGGRNLLRWTTKPTYTSATWNKDPKDTTAWSRWNTNITVEDTDAGIKGTFADNTQLTGFCIPLAYEDAAVGGEDYVLSFDYRTNLTTIGAPYLLRAAGGNISYSKAIAITPSETEWKHFSYVLNFPSTAGQVTRALLFPYTHESGGGKWLEIKDASAKLEKGNKPTDWSPAPEDTEAAIDTAVKSVAQNWFATCSTAAGTKDKVATITPTTEDFQLKAGVTVNVKFTVNNSYNATAANPITLNVNGSGAKNIYYANSATPTGTNTTAFGRANYTNTYVYDGTYWVWVSSSADNNTTYNMSQVLWNQAVKASADTYVGTHIIIGDSTGYRNLAAGKTFDLGYPILYYATAASTTIASGSTANNHYLQINAVNFATNGTITSGVAYATLYLKGTISGNIFTVAVSPFMTTVVPTAEDGYVYIPLGIMSNATSGRFVSSADLYAFIDGKFRQVTPTEIVATHRVYYRTATANSPLAAPTAWVEEATGNVYDQWTTKVPPLSTDKTSSTATKYLYLYTCEQRKRLDGTVECTKVLLDENTTVIDGGNIITGSVTANQVNFADASGNQLKLFDPSAPTNYQVISSGGNELFVDGVSVAEFGDTTRIGKPYVEGATDNESHMELDYHSMKMVDNEGTTYLHISDLRDRSGKATLVESGELVHRDWFPVSTPIASVDYVKVGDVTLDPSEYDIGNTVITFHEDQPDGSIVEVSYKTESSGVKAYTLGIRNGDAHVGSLSYAEGYEVEASGPISHAEGLNTKARGYGSHAEGDNNEASNYASHAEGKDTVASGYGSHAEGLRTAATNYYSHAEGKDTVASGDYSHAQNLGTVAASESQTAIGKFNIKDTGNKYAFIIGNGTDGENCSNAAAIDWLGNYIAQGWAGVIQMFAGSTPPNGWLLCDGRAVSRTTYATLYAAIGTTWGAGDGSTTFNLPDLRGCAPIGAGTGPGLTARPLGGKLGAESVTLTAAQSGLPAHTHSFTQPTITVTSKYVKDVASGSAKNRISNDGSSSTKTNPTATATGGAVGAVTGGAKGASSAHNNMQPSAVVNFIIHTGKTS